MKFRLDIRIVKPAVCLMAILVLLLGGMLFLRTWEEDNARVPAEPSEDVGQEDPRDGQELTWYNGGWYARRDDLELTLILGIDNNSEEGWLEDRVFTQADFLMLMAVDRKNKTCSAIHLNRDTMTDYQILTDSGRVVETTTGQLTLAHSYGGTEALRCKNTMNAVSNLLYGVKINHYISVTMDGVAALNDLAGGVTLEVMDDLTGFDPALVKGETVTLKGQQALTYIRSRLGLEDSSNLRRMERQRQYLEALQAQLTARVRGDVNFIVNSLLEVTPYMTSDCTVDQLAALSEAVEEYGMDDFRTLDGEADYSGEYVEFHVDEEALQSLVMELFYEQVEDG